jgi:DNA-3-methyladenine glycosylase
MREDYSFLTPLHSFLEPLPVAFYARPTLQVARDLLGCVVEHTTPEGTVAALIVEAEAYIGPEDPACHGYLGRRRATNLWGAPGIAYVYRSYGVHWLLNLVTERPDYPSAVLLRAAEPLAGEDLLALRCAGQPPRHWLVGPGRLTQGLGVDGRQDGLPVTAGSLVIRPGVAVPDERVRAGERIGISRGLELPWRLFLAGHPRVSAHRRGVPLLALGEARVGG